MDNSLTNRSPVASRWLAPVVCLVVLGSGVAGLAELDDVDSLCNETRSATVLATTPTTLVVPVVGARIESAEFTHREKRQLTGEDVLLEVPLDLSHDSQVHIEASTSGTATSHTHTIASGISIATDGSSHLCKESIRLLTFPSRGHYGRLDLSCQRRLAAGLHVIQWKVNSPRGTVQFRSGGVLAVKVFPAGVK